MIQSAEKMVEKVKTVLEESGLPAKAGKWMDTVQHDAPWLLRAASKLPFAPRLLGPLMVMARYGKGSKITVPEKGFSAQTIRGMLDFYRSFDMDGNDGKVFAYYYDPGPEADELSHEIYMKFLKTNALDPTVCPSVMALENELVEMSKNHVNADSEVVGNFTTGGTESIILAVKTARNWAREHKPQIKQPEMILPVTAHAAFQKAAEYLDVKPVRVEVDPVTYRADLKAVEEAITENTILLVGSAPSYAHGVIDPIRELGQLALKRDLLLHVDACVGGYLLHNFRKLGVEVPDYDFSVPGVTSLSMDLHKYGYTPKPASIILYKNKDLRRYQIFSFSGWTGYTIINSTLPSSRTGGPVAAAWSVMNFLGQDGYMKLAKTILDGTRKLIVGIENIPDLYVMGRPHMNLVAVTSDTINVFHIADEMKERGWYIQPQLGLRHYRENFHFSVQAGNVKHIDALLVDLAEATEAAKKLPISAIGEKVAKEFGHLKPKEMTEEIFWKMLKMAGIHSLDMPERMAEINEVLNVLSPEMADELLTRFFNEINKFKGKED